MGGAFGIWFGLLTVFGQTLGYKMGFAPSAGIEANVRRQLLGSLNRTVGCFFGGLVSGLLAHRNAEGLKFGFLAGAAIGLISAVVTNLIPLIERRVDHLPPRMLGAVGASLVVLGFVLQSVQYWVVFLDVPIKQAD